MKTKLLFLTVPVALLLHSCSSDSDYDFQTGQDRQLTQAAAAAAASVTFDPAKGKIPFPNSLLFNGSTDGTINAPVTEPIDPADPTIALNQMDGFSTTAPIVAEFNQPVDPATLQLGSSVRVFEVQTVPFGMEGAGAVLAAGAELAANQVFVTLSGSQLVILPLQPLKPKTDYMVVLTNGIKSDQGVELVAGNTFRLAKWPEALTGAAAPLEPVRQLTGTMLAAAAAATAGTENVIAADDVILSWTFKTQSVRDVLQAVKDQVAPGVLALANTGQTTANLPIPMQGKADLYAGTLEVPYYQTAGSLENPLAALGSNWKDQNGNPVNMFSPTPESTGTQVIPVLMTVPNATSMGGGVMPAEGWPITIFQHGITRNRLDMLPVADALADAGIAVIAIDIPMHGITDTTIAFRTETERTFGIDVINNDTFAQGPDGNPDPSGTHFYNLGNLANARDNLRQASADLFVLSASLASAQGITLDTTRKTFIGHSLGGIIGTTFMSFDDSVLAGSIAMSGSGIAQLLANSERFGPVIKGGLAAAQGLETDSAEFAASLAKFLVVAQTVVDSADPVNNATTLAASGRPVHVLEVNGDMVIPNAVAGAPLSGTDPLAKLLGLKQATGSGSTDTWVRFNQGDHGSIIDPTESLATTMEMQRQISIFAQSLGSIMSIDNIDVIDTGSTN